MVSVTVRVMHPFLTRAFLGRLAIHTAIGIDIFHQIQSANIRFFFIKEWLTVGGTVVFAVLMTVWMLLPCGDAVGQLSFQPRLCWIKSGRSYCRLMLFDLPLVLCYLFNMLIFVLATIMKRRRQVQFNSALLSYTVWYCGMFVVIFTFFLIQEFLINFSKHELPAWISSVQVGVSLSRPLPLCGVSHLSY